VINVGLIDANVLKKEIESYLLPYREVNYQLANSLYTAVYTLIISAPIVDAEPVVYCKDCFYSEELSKYIKEQYGSNVVHCTHPHWGGKLMKDYGFCCFGERNENKEIQICLTEDCPYQKGNPCEAWETCGGFEGKENE
jgi:hypothetical protein